MTSEQIEKEKQKRDETVIKYVAPVIMRQIIGGTKYWDKLVNNGWDMHAMHWLHDKDYIHGHDSILGDRTAIYLPTKAGIDWFNQLLEKNGA